MFLVKTPWKDDGTKEIILPELKHRLPEVVVRVSVMPAFGGSREEGQGLIQGQGLERWLHS